MKSGFSLTICYMLYLALALCICPVKSTEVDIVKNCTIEKATEEKQVVANNTEVLHEQLLFDAVGL